MKTYKRAKRRKDLYKKVKQRVNKFGYYRYWMKHTSKPCNCGMCRGIRGWNRYKRPLKQDIQKQAFEDIQDS